MSGVNGRGRRKRRRQADAAADDAIQHALWERAHVHDMALLASRPRMLQIWSRAPAMRRCRPRAAAYRCRHGSLPARSAPRSVCGGVYCAPGVSSAASAGRGSATGLRECSARRRARSAGARGAAGAVCAPTRGAARGACETGYAVTTGGDATAARARARRRGGRRCEQRSDRYYRFTLEGEAAPPPMPPINGLCNSRLCRPHLRP